MRGRQKGFTLIELLVVVGIIAALAAILIPNVARFVGRGQAEGAVAEKDSVQAAIDAAMADNGLLTVTENTGGVTDFSTVTDIDPGAGTVALYPTYMRLKDAKYGP